MADRVSQLLKRLNAVELDDEDAIAELETITDELRESADAFQAVEPILRFIEEHPDDDLGAPGPLVHFVETYYRRGYEALLVESVQRSPNELNVWMLNRLINGAKGADLRKYMAIMKSIAENEKVAENVRELAREFLEP